MSLCTHELKPKNHRAKYIPVLLLELKELVHSNFCARFFFVAPVFSVYLVMGTENYGTFPVKYLPPPPLKHGFFFKNFKATSKYIVFEKGDFKTKKKMSKSNTYLCADHGELVKRDNKIYDVMRNKLYNEHCSFRKYFSRDLLISLNEETKILKKNALAFRSSLTFFAVSVTVITRCTITDVWCITSSTILTIRVTSSYQQKKNIEKYINNINYEK